MRILLLSTAALSLLSVHWAQAALLDDQEATFAAAIKNAVAKLAAKNPGQPGIYGGGGYATFIPQIKTCLARGDENGAQNLVTSLLGMFPNEEEVQKAGQELLQSMEAAKKAREDASIQKINDILKQVPDTVNQAQQPKDLDDLLDALADLQENRDPLGPEAQKLSQQAQAAYRLVSQWQDYLSNRQIGLIDQAINNLKEVSNNPYSATIIPRSKILALAAALKPATASPAQGGGGSGTILEEIKAPEDLALASAKLKKLYALDPASVDPVDQQIVEQSLRIYNEVASSALVSLSFNANYNLNYDRASAPACRVQSMILLYALPRYLRVSGDYWPKTGEELKDYLNRISTQSGDEGDWKLLIAILDAQNAMGNNSRHPNLWPTLPSVRSLVAAQDQEAASQYALAVESYQKALLNLNEFVSAKLVGDRLTNIQKNHPEEYKEGMELFRTPLVPKGYFPRPPLDRASPSMTNAPAAPIR